MYSSNGSTSMSRLNQTKLAQVVQGSSTRPLRTWLGSVSAIQNWYTLNQASANSGSNSIARSKASRALSAS